MCTSVRHFTWAVDGYFRQSAVALPLQTRQCLVFLTLSICSVACSHRAGWSAPRRT
jgi:hypothetical protein